MIALLLNLMLLFRTLWRGMREDPEFRALMVAIGVILGGGTLFYWRAEGWSLVDSLYFCVITMATIGYGDLAPTTPVSKLFTVGFVIFGVGLFAAFLGKVVALMIKQRDARRRRHLDNFESRSNEQDHEQPACSGSPSHDNGSAS